MAESRDLCAYIRLCRLASSHDLNNVSSMDRSQGVLSIVLMEKGHLCCFQIALAVRGGRVKPKNPISRIYSHDNKSASLL